MINLFHFQGPISGKRLRVKTKCLNSQLNSVEQKLPAFSLQELNHHSHHSKIFLALFTKAFLKIMTYLPYFSTYSKL